MPKITMRLNPARKRAFEYKTSYQLNQLLRGKTYSQIGALLTSGKVTEAELSRYYRSSRETALKRVAAAERAGLPFGNKPEFTRRSNIVTTQQLVAEIADVNRFIKGPTTVTARKKVIEKRLNKMHARGMFENVNMSNYHIFERFMNWLNATGRTKSYDSESDEVETTIDAIINTGADSSFEFAELFAAVTGTGV